MLASLPPAVVGTMPPHPFIDAARHVGVLFQPALVDPPLHLGTPSTIGPGLERAALEQLLVVCGSHGNDSQLQVPCQGEKPIPTVCAAPSAMPSRKRPRDADPDREHPASSAALTRRRCMNPRPLAPRFLLSHERKRMLLFVHLLVSATSLRDLAKARAREVVRLSFVEPTAAKLAGDLTLWAKSAAEPVVFSATAWAAAESAAGYALGVALRGGCDHALHLAPQEQCNLQSGAAEELTIREFEAVAADLKQVDEHTSLALDLCRAAVCRMCSR